MLDVHFFDSIAETLLCVLVSNRNFDGTGNRIIATQYWTVAYNRIFTDGSLGYDQRMASVGKKLCKCPSPWGSFGRCDRSLQGVGEPGWARRSAIASCGQTWASD